MEGEAASSNLETSTSYPEDLVKIINESGYTKNQIFNVGKTALYCKKMPLRTFITREEKSMQFRSFKGQVDLLLEANTTHSPLQKP